MNACYRLFWMILIVGVDCIDDKVFVIGLKLLCDHSVNECSHYGW